MRTLISAIIIGFSVLLGVISYKKYAESEKKSRLLYQLCTSVISNNNGKMLGFYDLFCEVFGKIDDVYDTDSALKHLRLNYNKTRNFDEIFNALKELIGSGKADFDQKSALLIDASKTAYEKERDLVKRNGQSALILYPGATLIILILLL